MDRKEISTLFRKLYTPVRECLGGQCRISDADRDDLAIEVFERLLRYPKAEGLADPERYVFRVMYNVANEWKERFVNCKPHDADWLDDLVETTTPEDELVRELEALQVRAAIATLPDEYRVVLLLSMNEDLKQEAIADRLHISKRQVLRRFQRGYKLMRQALDDGTHRKRNGRW
jgi:RNA polymerase sigma factor (sigma-70 family)